MNAPRILRQGWGLAVLCGPIFSHSSRAQSPEPTARPAPAAVAPSVRPASGGTPHEAILVPPGDLEPIHVEKAPPAPIEDRSGDDPPGPTAVHIPGYWEWDPGLGDFAWIAGTWRDPPPGRFWANGFWKREAKGWYRVPGFWSDRRVDRIAWRDQGPPEGRPVDEPGPAPAAGHFYIAGRYAPEGDGVAWKKGFWAKAQPGWEWVPARWVRQPDGWTVQEGFWDRPPEDREARPGPTQAADAARSNPKADPTRSRAIPGQSRGRSIGIANSSLNGHPGRDDDRSDRYRGVANPMNYGPSITRLDNPYVAPQGNLNRVQSGVNNYLGNSIVSPSVPGLTPNPYYGNGIGYYPGYYNALPYYGQGLGYYPGYYGNSGGPDLGGRGVQAGGLIGYPHEGHGLGYYPGYFGR